MKHANCLGALAAALLGLVPALHAQVPQLPAPVVASTPQSMPAPQVVPGPSAVPGAVDGAMPHQAVHPPGVSSWLAYPRSPTCCGPIGKHGPIFAETYTRHGISIPIATNRFTRAMQIGYTGSVGFRTLLFNPEVDTAWVIDFGLSSTWNHLVNADVYRRFDVEVIRNIFGQNITEVVPIQDVTPIRVHSSTVNLSIGQECYLWGTAACDGTSKCRVGWDVGGRYGTSSIHFQVERHSDDVVGGFFLAAHTDYEFPFGCCMFSIGARAEGGMLFNDLLQRQNDTDILSINVLITAGVRF